MKRFIVFVVGVLFSMPPVSSAVAAAEADQIGKPVSELVEMELLTSSEVVEKQKAGFINVIIANGGTEARGPQNILAGHTIMSQILVGVVAGLIEEATLAVPAVSPA